MPTYFFISKMPREKYKQVLHALLDDDTLGRERHRSHHPPFVITAMPCKHDEDPEKKSSQIAQDNGHAITNLPECVAHWHARLIEGHVCGTGGT
jgi:hypothetical protein